jgi:hypothetical protein
VSGLGTLPIARLAIGSVLATYPIVATTMVW